VSHLAFRRKPKKTQVCALLIEQSIYYLDFTAGTSDIYRPTYLMDEDVVIVTINYRLGAIGK